MRGSTAGAAAAAASTADQHPYLCRSNDDVAGGGGGGVFGVSGGGILPLSRLRLPSDFAAPAPIDDGATVASAMVSADTGLLMMEQGGYLIEGDSKTKEGYPKSKGRWTRV